MAGEMEAEGLPFLAFPTKHKIPAGEHDADKHQAVAGGSCTAASHSCLVAKSEIVGKLAV